MDASNTVGLLFGRGKWGWEARGRIGNQACLLQGLLATHLDPRRLACFEVCGVVHLDPNGSQPLLLVFPIY